MKKKMNLLTSLILLIPMLLNPAAPGLENVLAQSGQAQDQSVQAVFSVTNTNDSGSGSLRQAILDANANPGADTITFAIGATGSQQIIQPISALPTITDPVTVDGWSQGGAGYSGPPLIDLNGALAGNSTVGLNITAGSSTVRGLVINGFIGISRGGHPPANRRGQLDVRQLYWHQLWPGIRGLPTSAASGSATARATTASAPTPMESTTPLSATSFPPMSSRTSGFTSPPPPATKSWATTSA